MGASTSTDTTMSEADIRALIQKKDIVLFVSSSCPYCSDAISILKEKGHNFDVIEVSSSQRSTLRSMTGMSSVPSCWVKGVFVGGCNDGPEGWMGIAKMVRNGELAKRLS